MNYILSLKNLSVTYLQKKFHTATRDRFKLDLFTNSLFQCLFLHVFLKCHKTAGKFGYLNRFRFNAVADKRHSSVAF